jgi:hypothetical protein
VPLPAPGASKGNPLVKAQQLAVQAGW